MADMLSFTAFVRKVLGVKLTPGQRALALVAFDGKEPAELRGVDREHARQLFGPVEAFPAVCRDVLACVAGARGGKTYTLLALRALHLALTCDMSSLAPGELGFGILVAPDLRLARQGLRFAAGAAVRAPSIAKLIEKNGADELELLRPDGKRVRIEVLPATRGGSAVRARSYYFVGLDEACFFYADDGFTVTDSDIFAAASPRVLPAGQIVVVSTPWLESGVLYDLFVRNHPEPGVAIDGEPRPGTPTDAIAAHAPTLLLNDSERNRRAVTREQTRAPENAEREFGARFVAKGTGRFFDANAIKLSMEDRPSTLDPLQGVIAVAAIDPAFTSDTFALVVVRREDGKARTVEIAEWKPRKGAPLKPSEVIGEAAERAKAHGCTCLYTDVHYQASVAEHAAAHELAVDVGPGGLNGKMAVFTTARDALLEGRCELSAEHEVLAAQLRAVLSKPLPGGGLAITSPRRRGSHGDVASAWVLATWALEQLGDTDNEDLADLNRRARMSSGSPSRWATTPGRGFG